MRYETCRQTAATPRRVLEISFVGMLSGDHYQEIVAGTTGLEPATSAVTGQRSNQLSYVPKQRDLV